MGHSLDARGYPEFNDESDPLPDLTAAVDYARKIGGLLKLTSEQRQNLTAGETEVGWLFAEIDTGRLYYRSASAPQGVLIWQPGSQQTVTMQGIYQSHPTYPIRLFIENGRAFLEGQARTNTTPAPSFTTGPEDNYLLAKIPAAIAPAEDQLFLVPASPNNSARLSVKSDGDIIFAVLSGFNVQLSMGLGGITWRPKP